MQRQQREEERIQGAAMSAAMAQAEALGMTPEELQQTIEQMNMHEQHHVVCYPGPQGDRDQEKFLEDSKTFVTIWPNYLDVDKSLPQGRRIPKDKACPKPSVHDISDLLVQWRLAHIVEQHKRYPRDWLVYGRVKVELKDSKTGKQLHPDFPSRRALMLKLGECIPSLSSRKIRLEAEAAGLRAAQQKNAAAAAAAATAASTAAAGAGGGEGGAEGGGGGGGNPKKKKGKKGRK
ncbi:hypothetical protein VYU27_008984 [Nannochloropsis oceanica]